VRRWAGKRYWLVGASEGLGRALAERMSRAGVELVLSARHAGRLQELAGSLPGRATVVPVDVADSACVRAARERAGEIDGVVILSGVYWPMAAQDWRADQVEAMCDTNFTGTARVLGSVVPGFTARDAGHIVLTGSLAGFRGLPGATGYAASKAGVMAMAEGLHADLRKRGVEVQLVNPGFVRTRLTDRNDFAMPFLMEPDAAAQLIFDHMSTGGFARSFPAPFSWLFRLGAFLPDGLYYRIFA